MYMYAHLHRDAGDLNLSAEWAGSIRDWHRGKNTNRNGALSGGESPRMEVQISCFMITIGF
jgi:hypothetical protein